MSGSQAAGSGGAGAGEGEALLSLETARAQMLAGIAALPPETVPLEAAVGRRLAAPVTARLTLPPWDNTAMDGFAVRAADVAGASAARPVTLQVTGEVAAGYAPALAVEPGTAVRILTGAMLPPGADAVVPVELTDAAWGVAALPPRVAIRAPVAPGAHVRRAGEDVRAGQPLLPRGTTVGPAGVALLAAAGHATVAVYRRPRVAVLPTGDELVAEGEPLGPGQIHDSNAPMLAAQARTAGAEVERLPIAPDRLTAVVALLEGALASGADVIVVSGGVSVGAYDVVRAAFERLGRVELWRVAIQPGKPLAFARAARPRGGVVLLFGLPGNPVSSFVTFELFVRPALRALGGDPDPTRVPAVRARLTETVRKDAARRAFVRVTLAPDEVRAGGWLASLSGVQGSHVLSALALADGLAVIPEGVAELPAGAEVDVWLLTDHSP